MNYPKHPKLRKKSFQITFKKFQYQIPSSIAISKDNNQNVVVTLFQIYDYPLSRSIQLMENYKDEVCGLLC